MGKTIKSICMVLLTSFIIFTSSIPVSNAATSQLIIINSKNNTLNFYENNTLVRKFKCATGKSSTPTPQRKTTIVNKIKNRPYYKYGIPGGDPRNPLGKRWMGLNMYGYGTTYGIHGTNNESSIGKHISNGCIRMHNKDVEWLFNKIKIGATVIIKNTSNSDEWIAKQYKIKLNKKIEKNTWYTKNGYKYYRKSNGKNATGWNTINGKTYYFDNKGKMQTGLKTISNKKYYLGKDGVRRTGWQTINGNKYYFEKSGNKKGQALKGKIKISGKYYYFDNDYKMVKNKLVKDYYYGKDGEYVKDKQVKYKDNYYYVGSNGKIIKNKEKKGFYYNEKGKAYKDCVKDINGYTYTFDKNGKIVNKVKIAEKEESSEEELQKNKEIKLQEDTQDKQQENIDNQEDNEEDLFIEEAI